MSCGRDPAKSPTRGVGPFWAVAAAVTAVALATRLAFRIDYPEEVDSIRFLEALDDFDVTAHRPHFPGYPVFVLLGRAFLLVLGEPTPALATLCAVSGALLPVVVALFVRATSGDRAAIWALVLAAANPLLWLSSEKLLSDVPGLVCTFAALGLLTAALREPSRGALPLGGAFFALGLALGVRLSYFPFAISAAALAWRRGRSLVAPASLGSAGVLAWALPVVAVTGPSRLWETATMQTGGHFGRWGGSVATESDLGLRAGKLAWELTAQGLGTFWSDRSPLYLVPTAALVVLMALAARRLSRADREAAVTAAWLVVPYLAWAFVGQNIVAKERHALPLVVLSVALLSRAAARACQPGAPGESRALPFAAAVAGAVFAAGNAASGWALAREHQAVPSNAVALSREVGRMCGDPSRPAPIVYTASLERHLAIHAPCATVVRVRRLSEARRDLDRRAGAVTAFVVSDVARLDRLHARPIATFRRNRYVQNALSELDLYELRGGHG